MCGIAGIVGGGPPTRAVLERMACHAWPIAARTDSGRGPTSTPASPSAGSRSSTSTRARCSRCTSAPGTSSSTARSTTTASCARELRASRPRVRDRGRRRGAAARLGRVGGGRARPLRRHVRLRDLARRAAASSSARCDPFGEKPLYWAATASGSCSPPTSARCSRRGRTSARLGRTRSARSSARGLMPPIDESFFAGDPPAARRAPAALGSDGRVEVTTATGARGRSTCPARYEDAVDAAARAAPRLDPPAAARRRPGRHLAQRRRRLVGGRRAVGDARRRPPPPRVHRPLPRLRARRVALRRRGRSRRPGRRAPCCRADRGRAPRRPRRARRLPAGACSVRRASTRSGVSCGAAREAGVTVLLGRAGSGRASRRLPRGEWVGAPVRWAARGHAWARLDSRPGRHLSERSARSERPQSSREDIVGRR